MPESQNLMNKVKILFLAANPAVTNKLNLDEELHDKDRRGGRLGPAAGRERKAQERGQQQDVRQGRAKREPAARAWFEAKGAHVHGLLISS